MPFLKTKSGINWNYDCEGHGDALVFVHGWGVDKRIWRQQTKYFSQHFRVLTIDLPGHGQSTWLRVSLAQMAEDFNAVTETLNFVRMRIVGSSLGGLLTFKFHALFPEKVQSLTLVGSMPKFSQSDDHPYGLDIERMRILGQQLQSAYPDIVNIFFRSLFTNEERASRRYKWLQKFKKFDGIPEQEALAEYLNILEHEDLREDLKAIKIPLQFINGTEDYICDAETVAFLRSLAPKARFDDFPRCGHFPFLSKPYEFNMLLHDFFKGNHGSQTH